MAKRLKRYPVRGLVDELNFEGVYFGDGTEDVDLREYLNYCIRKEAEAKIEAEELGRRHAWLNWAGGWAVQAQARGAT